MSNKVLAAALKSAVNTSAMKQVAAAGFTVQNSACVFSGTRAYAVWDDGQYGRYQRRWGIYPVRKFRINYPAIPDEAMLTRSEADLIAAYTLHETGHVIYTPNDRTIVQHNYGSKYHRLANGFEDGRMEAAVILGGVAKNARQLFQRLLNKLTSDIDRRYNPCDIANAPFTLALLAREALGNGNRYTSQLLGRIPEPYRAIYAAAYDACKTAPMGYDHSYWAYQQAVIFLTAWNRMRQDQGNAPDQPEPEGDEPDDSGDDEQDEPSGKGKSKDESEEDEQDESDDDGSGGDSEDGDYDEGDQPDDGDDFGDAEDGKMEEPETNPGDQPGDQDTEPGDPSDQSGDETGDQPDDGDDQDDSPDDGGGEFNGSNDSGEPKSPEPNIDDVFKRINKRSDGSKKSALGAFTPAERDTDVLDYLLKEGGFQ